MPMLDAGYRLLQIARFSFRSGYRFFSSASEFDSAGDTPREAMTHQSWLATKTSERPADPSITAL
jgi:hypothetical protein